MFVNTRSSLMRAALLLTLGSAAAAALPAPFAFAAAPLVQKAAAAADGTAEPTTASLLADIHLPSGANRATGTNDLAKFNQALGEAARANRGTINNTEVLVWTGDDAKSVVSGVSARLKENGYMVGEVTPFEAEVGRVTPLAAIRGDQSDKLVGMWIQTKNGDALLVWGRFLPNGTPAPAAAAAATPAKKPVVAATKKTPAGHDATPAELKNALASLKTPPPAKASTTGETAAQRQAKAMKALQDYQYVKYMGPISGSMYRSSKW